MAEGVEERRSKRRPPCNGADRASATRGYPARKGADFRHGLNGWEALDRLGLLETLGACYEIAGVRVIDGWEKCGMRREAALCGSLHPFRGSFCGLFHAADRVPV